MSKKPSAITWKPQQKNYATCMERNLFLKQMKKIIFYLIR
uniref:Bm13281, isoform a n=1 Tax=Brugia malayi TaxID=6279 RepID=A0A1I9G3A3_BRUMA|nr:Bm13281, isoform a [Brugia malayi]